MAWYGREKKEGLRPVGAMTRHAEEENEFRANLDDGLQWLEEGKEESSLGKCLAN